MHAYGSAQDVAETSLKFCLITLHHMLIAAFDQDWLQQSKCTIWRRWCIPIDVCHPSILSSYLLIALLHPYGVKVASHFCSSPLISISSYVMRVNHPHGIYQQSSNLHQVRKLMILVAGLCRRAESGGKDGAPAQVR